MPMFRLAIKSDANVKPCCVGFGEKNKSMQYL